MAVSFNILAVPEIRFKLFSQPDSHLFKDLKWKLNVLEGVKYIHHVLFVLSIGVFLGRRVEKTPELLQMSVFFYTPNNSDE